MRHMPTIIHSNPTGSDLLPDNGMKIPVAPAGSFDRAVAHFLGSLTADEQAFADRAASKNWTIRVIIEAILEQRGLPTVPNEFNWRTL